MRLEYPALLLAAPPLLLALLLLARRGAAAGRRPRAAFALRFLILLALSTALAGPTVSARTPGPSVVFALDVSDSVRDDALERACEAIRGASKDVAARGGTSSLVLFAGRAVVARPPSSDPIDFGPDLRARIFSRRAAQEAASEDRAASPEEKLERLRTRSVEALTLARRLHPAGSEARTALITDGMETDPGSAPTLDPSVRVFRLPESSAPEVALRSVRAPLAVRAGEAFDVEVDAWSARDGEARLALMLNGQVVAEDDTPRTIRAGRSTLRVRNVQNALGLGLHRLQAVVTAEGDTEARNNAASTSFNIVGKSRVLIVEAAPTDGEGLSRLLAAQGVDHERRALDRMVTGSVDLDRWSVVVLAGVPPAAVPLPTARALAEWLEDGGGLFYVATATPPPVDAFNRHEFTKLLPVALEAPKPVPKSDGAPGPPAGPSGPSAPAPTAETRKVLAPSVALLLMIDKSASMAGDPIALCKEAAIATLQTLGEKDFLGVLAFDRGPVWLQRFEAAHRTELIRNNILRLYADGGTDLLPALEEARRAFRTQEGAKTAGVKHIIILSDGETPARNYEKSVKGLVEDGVVVSSVCVVGPGGFRDQIMRKLAQWGRGRYFFAESFRKVPRIFTDETKFVLKEAAAKAESESTPPPPPPPPTTPDDSGKPPPDKPPPDAVAPGAGGKVVFKDDHEVLRGIPREPVPPPLKGALAGKARETSYVPLAFEDGTPALAVWRYGLGRAAVWSSDLGGPWSAGWDKWPGTTKLFVQVVRHLSNAAETVDLGSAVRVERRGNRVEIRTDEGVALHELAPTRRELESTPDADGGRKCVLNIDGHETRHVSLSRTVDGRNESLTVEFVPGPGAEIAAAPDRPPPFAWTAEAPSPLDRLAAETTPPPSSDPEPRAPVGALFLLAALVLVPLDVAVRRIQ